MPDPEPQAENPIDRGVPKIRYIAWYNHAMFGGWIAAPVFNVM